MAKGARWVAAVALGAALAAGGGCGGDSDTVATAGQAGPGTVVVRDIAFKPKRLAVEAGDTVTWRFEDKGIPHDVKAQDGSFESEVVDSGTFEHTFERPGTYEYVCSIHPTQMKAVIEVR